MFEWLQEFLITHNFSVHEGMQYECDQREFKITLKVTLRHMMSVHDGFKYECDQCDYKATLKGYLKSHKMAVHEGM